MDRDQQRRRQACTGVIEFSSKRNQWQPQPEPQPPAGRGAAFCGADAPPTDANTLSNRTALP